VAFEQKKTSYTTNNLISIHSADTETSCRIKIMHLTNNFILQYMPT